MSEEKFDWKRLVERLMPAEFPKPPLPRFLFEGLEHHSVWVAGEEVDSSLEAMKERYKGEWRKKSILEEGPIRRRVRELLEKRSRVVERGSVSKGYYEEAGIEKMVEEKRAEWQRKDYPDHFIRMAEDLAREWTSSMVGFLAPPELREAITPYVMEKGLAIANRWITTMAVAVK